VKIYKYRVERVDHPVIQMPKGAHVLTFQNQREEPCIWAIVDPEVETEPRVFLLAGTGHPFPEDPTSVRHLGTAQFNGGNLVFHLFEKIR